MRGRSERELLDELGQGATRPSQHVSSPPPAPVRGVPAREACAPRLLRPLPEPLPVGPYPGQPRAFPDAPGAPDRLSLDQLATDAAARAHALLTTGADPVIGLTLWQDAVRLAAARPTAGLTATTRKLYRDLAASHRPDPHRAGPGGRRLAAGRHRQDCPYSKRRGTRPAGPF